MEKITNLFLKKNKNSPPLPSLSCHEQWVHGNLEGGGVGGIYRRGSKAPVGAQQPVPNNRHKHRLKLPTGAFVVGTWLHWVMAKPGAIVRPLGTGRYRLVAPTGAYTGVLISGDALIWYQTSYLWSPLAKGTSCFCNRYWCVARTFGLFSNSEFRHQHRKLTLNPSSTLWDLDNVPAVGLKLRWTSPGFWI